VGRTAGGADAARLTPAGRYHVLSPVAALYQYTAHRSHGPNESTGRAGPSRSHVAPGKRNGRRLTVPGIRHHACPGGLRHGGAKGRVGAHEADNRNCGRNRDVPRALADRRAIGDATIETENLKSRQDARSGFPRATSNWGSQPPHRDFVRRTEAVIHPINPIDRLIDCGALSRRAE